MISPELLRRYTFFGTLDDAQLKAVAMISDETIVETGKTLFEEGDAADTLYFLIEGSISLYYVAEEKYHPESRKEFLVGEINPGEVFAISVLIEPYKYTSTARVDRTSRVLKIQSAALRRLLENECDLGFKIMCEVARAAMERLSAARVILAGCNDKA
jgi:CRP-like cAMP-binding protein